MPSAETIELEPTFAAAVDAWLEYLRRNGTPQVYILSGRRSNEEQYALRVQNCPDPDNSPSGDCDPPTAPVGASKHNRGEAVDIAPASAYSAAGAAAARFNLTAPVAGEPWHFELQAGAGAPQGIIGGLGDAAGSIAGGALDAAGTAGQVLSLFADPGLWVRVGVGAAGVILVILGMVGIGAMGAVDVVAAA